MNPLLTRSSLAALAAVTFELTMVAGANAHDRARQSADADNRVAQAQSTAPASPGTTTNDTAGTTQSTPTGNDAREGKQPVKHPPTAQMDKATPTDKTTNGTTASGKHPPTSAMDKAAPDEKSPGARQ